MLPLKPDLIRLLLTALTIAIFRVTMEVRQQVRSREKAPLIRLRIHTVYTIFSALSGFI